LKTPQKILVFLYLCLAVLSLYIFLHEGGHALTAVIQGARLNEFDLNPFNAHVNFSGELTRSGRAVMNISGAALPLLAWFAWMLVTRRRDTPLIELVKLISAMGVLNTALVWIILPFVYLAGNAPPGDDVTHFLDNSGANPLLLASGAALLYILGWVLFFKRSVGLRPALLTLRDPAPWDPNKARARILWAGAILLLVWGSAITLKLTLPGAAAQPVEPPAGYARAASIDLSAGDLEDFELAHFSLSSPGGPGIFVEVREINTPHIDLRLVGPGSYEQVILRGEGYSASLDTPWLQPDPNMPAGAYSLRITNRQSPGTLTVYLQQP